jgi:hypothetical protein
MTLNTGGPVIYTRLPLKRLYNAERHQCNVSGHSSCWAASTPIGPHVARSMGLGPANGSAPL